MKNRQFTIIGVPIDCLGKTGALSGTELSPIILRQHGLVDALNAKNAGDLPVRIDDSTRDLDSGVVGIESVCKVTDAIRQQVRRMLGDGQRPLLVGGCCTAVIGAMAGATDRAPAPVGLAYVAGRMGLYDDRTSPTGAAADMVVACLLGCGPPRIMERIKPAPLNAKHLMLLGFRDLAEAALAGSMLPADTRPPLIVCDAQTIKAGSPSDIGEAAASNLSRTPRRFWLHLGFDVLDQLVFQAADYPMPGGLSWDELEQLLKPLAISEALIGVSIAGYNPEKDSRSGDCAKAIVQHMQSIFAPA